MKQKSKASRAYRQMPEERPQGPSRSEIAGWADRVEAGQVVTTDLNDGSFVALMAELRRRGYEPAPRRAAEVELKPFMFKVARRNAKHD